LGIQIIRISLKTVLTVAAVSREGAIVYTVYIEGSNEYVKTLGSIPQSTMQHKGFVYKVVRVCGYNIYVELVP